MKQNWNSDIYRSAIVNHWDEFKKIPGSQAIASKAALFAIISLTLIRPPRKLLEIGAGLGTITNLILEFTSSEIISTEPVPGLLDKLKIYESDRLKVIKDESQLEIGTFLPDWIIVDGPCNIKIVEKLLAPETLQVVIVENQRIKTRVDLGLALFQKGIRFNYCELDTSEQTGIAAFLTITSKVAKQSFFGKSLDLIAFLVRLGPRFLKQVVQSRGKSLRIGSALEDAEGI